MVTMEITSDDTMFYYNLLHYMFTYKETGDSLEVMSTKKYSFWDLAIFVSYMKM